MGVRFFLARLRVNECRGTRNLNLGFAPISLSSHVIFAKPVKILRIFVGSLLPTSGKKKTDTRLGVRFFLAAELGIEPRQRDSETLVLPLHNSAKLRSLLRTGLLYSIFLFCQGIFCKKGRFFVLFLVLLYCFFIWRRNSHTAPAAARPA